MITQRELEHLLETTPEQNLRSSEDISALLNFIKPDATWYKGGQAVWLKNDGKEYPADPAVGFEAYAALLDACKAAGKVCTLLNMHIKNRRFHCLRFALFDRRENYPPRKVPQCDPEGKSSSVMSRSHTPSNVEIFFSIPLGFLASDVLALATRGGSSWPPIFLQKLPYNYIYLKIY
jgi:hypothetical protein